MKNNRELLEYISVIVSIYLILFGGIYFAGVYTGVDWTNYWIDFSWTMLNVEELKQIIGL
ncbi:hypothetical protein [Halobacillus karajensis]|uniref:hypothetical protein n=1 Tax=Halobacillus karajensis TaxID=195088 RepID=UPI000B1F18D6